MSTSHLKQEVIRRSKSLTGYTVSTGIWLLTFRWSVLPPPVFMVKRSRSVGNTLLWNVRNYSAVDTALTSPKTWIFDTTVKFLIFASDNYYSNYLDHYVLCSRAHQAIADSGLEGLKGYPKIGWGFFQTGYRSSGWRKCLGSLFWDAGVTSLKIRGAPII